MHTKCLGFLAGFTVVVALGAVAVQHAAPETQVAVTAFIHDQVSGWDEAACRANPDGCLRAKYRELVEVEGRLGSSIGMLQGEEERLGAVSEDQVNLLQRNDAFLSEGRSLLTSGEQHANEPIHFAGRSYPSAAIFRSQMQLLFTERSTLAKVLDEGRELARKLQEKREALMIQRANVKAARQMIPGNLALIQGNQMLDTIDGSLAIIDRTISAGEDGLRDVDGLIGTTQDLVKSQAASGRGRADASGMGEDFDAFLRGGGLGRRP